MSRMPAAFIGHGSPMNALETNRYTEAWRLFGQSVPRPRAILAISAHWYINATAVTTMAKPKTIHDFYGFPQELFDVSYEAPGLPELAEEIADVVAPTWVGADVDSWGLDHGTWSVLVHAFPGADIPVVQLALNAAKPLEYHYELGAQLAPLRDAGILVLGSGNVVHNLGRIDPRPADAGFDWAERFNDAARQVFLETPSNVTELAAHPDFRAAVPTPDHFIPMLYLAGLASDDPPASEILIDGYVYGSLSMTSYVLGAHVPAPAAFPGDFAAPPFPDVDPEDTNL